MPSFNISKINYKPSPTRTHVKLSYLHKCQMSYCVRAIFSTSEASEIKLRAQSSLVFRLMFWMWSLEIFMDDRWAFVKLKPQKNKTIITDYRREPRRNILMTSRASYGSSDGCSSIPIWSSEIVFQRFQLDECSCKDQRSSTFYL